MGALQALGAVLPLSFTAGINLYLTVLVVGLSMRLGLVQDIPQGFAVLASTPVLLAAGILYLVEFFADKIQFVDNVWDAIHTFVRPAGAIVLSANGIVDFGLEPAIEVIIVLLAGGVALTAHGGKAGTRTAVNTASPAENISNILISLAEDAAVAVIAVLSLLYPMVANAIVVIALALIVFFVPQILRWTWFMVRSLFARIRALLGRHAASQPLPPEYAALIDEQQPLVNISAQAQRIPQAGGFAGYLALLPDDLYFLYSRWFRPRVWRLPLDRVREITRRERWLLTTLELTYLDDKQRVQTARFSFLKDRRALVTRMIEQVQQTMAQSTTVG